MKAERASYLLSKQAGEATSNSVRTAAECWFGIIIDELLQAKKKVFWGTFFCTPSVPCFRTLGVTFPILRKFLDILRKYLDILKKYLGILRKSLDILRKSLGILRKYLGILRVILETLNVQSEKMCGKACTT